ncbi:ferritin-like metal-binding protein YciE [Agrobacterium larrymoorei]|uniref:Ferritin-like metal-binding protein YciE n=1 Tax=Agrobacterium larrymoorei TaxID=160699 RepID=A0AAJ2ET34_9HYPH|nr:ferritin-like domain-containing protein [Agrobacterium larrymoorei]MDR6099882.1 ferritin-like metal-binding protein YciE [Agrobacterium larrymoorei]
MATAEKSSKENKSSRTAVKKTARASGTKSVAPSSDTRRKRAQAVASKSAAKKATRVSAKDDKSLSDLFEHALGDIYYAEKKIYKSLPKMIKAADHPDLVQALTSHREETAGQIEKLEAIFELLGKRAKAEKCDAIDGVLEESESLLEDFGSSVAADAAIIFSCQAIEHYEITRYGSMRAFADALGMDEAKQHIDDILAQEKAADTSLTELAEDSVNAAASDYDEE